MSAEATTQDLETVREIWDQRRKAPLAAADAVAERYQVTGATPHQLALELGTNAAELTVYLDLAGLTPDARDILVSQGLPLSLASDLVSEEEDVQAPLLDELVKKLTNGDDVVRVFEKILESHQLSQGVHARSISGGIMMHLASKAKHYSVLSGRKRKALFDIGRKKNFGLSDKQIRYMDSILEELEEAGILTAACPDDPCDHCDELRSILGGDS